MFFSVFSNIADKDHNSKIDMKKVYTVTALFFLFCIPGGYSQKFDTIIVDGYLRHYILYLPEKLPDKAPLVFVFHGYSGSAKNTMESIKMNDIAKKNGFAVCYPEGLTDQNGNTFWQVGYLFHRNLKINDLNFIRILVSKLQSKYKLSTENLFMTGFSNGGDLCNLLACKTNGIFKAMAPIISCIMKQTFDSCNTTKPIPVLMLNGTKDSVTFWNGDMSNLQGYGPYLPTKDMFDFRIAQNDCEFSKRDTLYNTQVKQDSYVIKEEFINNITNNQVWMYTVVNGDHGFPKYLNLEQEIWNFFNIYIKN